MRAYRNITLVIGKELASDRGIRRGIYALARPQYNWGFQTSSDSAVAVARPTSRDGVIGFLSQESAATLCDSNTPFVNLSQDRDVAESRGRPLVGIDYRAAGRQAAEYFLGKGHHSLGLVAGQITASATDMIAGIRSATREKDVEVAIYEPEGDYPSAEIPDDAVMDFREHLFRFIAALPQPSAVIASDAVRGLEVVEICRRTHLPVPERLSVLAIGDDDMYCSMAFPPLSGVRLPWRQVGYRAAELLSRQFAGEQLPDHPVLYGPVGIEERQSTNILAIEDSEIREAMQYIRLRARDGIEVQDVLRHIARPRKWLERRFQLLVGRTPLQEIQRVRIHDAKTILVDTDLTLEKVAFACGYNSLTRFSLAFKKHVGIPPGQFRRQFSEA
jgi:LacI family transcriptional regulator